MSTTYILSPNMSLPVPEVSIAPGTDYASDINNCMAVLDQHTHAFGSGIAVTPDGLNINTDLTFQSNNLTFLKTIQFVSQSTTIPAVTPYINSLYVSGVDLYYNDGANNIVRITQSGGVAGSPGSIANLTSPASASYVSGDQTFVWESAANTAANMDFGAAIFRNITASSNGITVSPPAALATSYGIQWFSALPGTPSFVTIDSAGNLAAPIATAGGITLGNLAAPNIVMSASCGNFQNPGIGFVAVTNFSVTITTSGKPVYISFQGETFIGNNSWIGTGGAEAIFSIFRGGTEIVRTICGATTVGAASINFIDTTVGAGTYTYSLQAAGNSGTAFVQYCVMTAREM